MCSALRFCLSVYLSLSPRGMAFSYLFKALHVQRRRQPGVPSPAVALGRQTPVPSGHPPCYDQRMDRQANTVKGDRLAMPAEASHALTIVQRCFASSLVAVYLHGSAATGGLRPNSDVDLLVIVDRPTTLAVRERLM